MVVRYEFAPVVWGEELPSTKQTRARVQPGTKKVCRDCGGDFVLTPGEERFYASKRIPEPKRCSFCRKKNAVKHKHSFSKTKHKSFAVPALTWEQITAGVKELKER